VINSPNYPNSIYSKVNEGFMYDRHYIQIIDKLNPNQYGTVKKSSTAHSLVSPYDFIQKALDRTNTYYRASDFMQSVLPRGSFHTYKCLSWFRSKSSWYLLGSWVSEATTRVHQRYKYCFWFFVHTKWNPARDKISLSSIHCIGWKNIWFLWKIPWWKKHNESLRGR